MCIGVRRIRIEINQSCIFEGDLDRGCGNQLFDYSQTFEVQKSGCNTMHRTNSNPDGSKGSGGGGEKPPSDIGQENMTKSQQSNSRTSSAEKDSKRPSLMTKDLKL